VFVARFYLSDAVCGSFGACMSASADVWGFRAPVSTVNGHPQQEAQNLEY
jgi:hypothetical protein